MPIYMDRHDVSEEVTAEIVADLHQKDLKIQHRFNCKGLTYWFDDKRKTAFCLVEAPGESAIREMHEKAHGEVPNRIIEVDNAVVESFLGRIEDPEKSQKTALNIINDPAFRTIMVAAVKTCSLKDSLDKKIIPMIFTHRKSLCDTLILFKGRIVSQQPDHFLVSFDSVTNAVLCALKLQEEFNRDFVEKPDPLVKLQIGLKAGVPVDEENGFFENTVKAAHSFMDVIKASVVMASEVRELFESENLNIPVNPRLICTLSPSEEKFLIDLADFTAKEWNSNFLNPDKFCRCLGYSKSGFYRKIVALTGKSPNAYLKEYRLGKARELLDKKSLNISEVAFETGFNSAAYFSKCFHETFGVLPSRYIRSAHS